MMTLRITILASVLALTSCSNSTPKKETEKEKEAKQRQEALSRLESDYKGSRVFSSDDNEILTYELQEAIHRNPILILKDFDIVDISRGDSLWTFKLGSVWHSSGHIAEITCAEPMAMEILTVLRAEERAISYYAARIRAVSRIRFVATAYGTSDENGEVVSAVVFEDEPPLLLKGELLEVR